MNRRLVPLFVALAVLIAGAPAASAHPVTHPNAPVIRNLRPPAGEAVPAGSTTIAAQVVNDAGITSSSLTVDGNPVATSRQGDGTHPTVVGTPVNLGFGHHIAQLTVTDSRGRSTTRAWRFSNSDIGFRRLAGNTRYETAAAISRDLYAAPGTAKAAVLARGDNFADALAAVPLARQVDGPLLLSERGQLPAAAADELRRVLPPGAIVYLMGGGAALNDAVEAAVAGLGFDPERVAGENRFGTATAAARLLDSPTGAIVANGFSFPDALSASSPAARQGIPILLTSKDTLPPETRQFLTEENIPATFVVGGDNVVSPGVAGQLPSPTRLAGGDRYATSAAVARHFFPTTTIVGIASGETFPDALAGGRSAAAAGGPMLLTPTAALRDPVADYIGATHPTSALLYGGGLALADSIVPDLRRATLDNGGPHLTGVSPLPNAETPTLDTIELLFDRNLVLQHSSVYVEINGEEVKGSYGPGEFPSEIVFNVAEIPLDPPAGVRADIRVVALVYDGTNWRHVDYRFGYKKLTLSTGDSGETVRQLQQRLTDLGYWNGNADGRFGLLTSQAVYAFQKVHGLRRTGAVDDRTRAAINAAGGRPAARSTSGHVIEIDKPRQVLFSVTNGRVDWILNISTGNDRPYTVDGETSVARTPEGRFTFFRQIDGVRESRLGTLYRPKYFTQGGHAVHGSNSVPPYPASHGCVRVTNPAADWIWANNIIPMGTPLLVY